MQYEVKKLFNGLASVRDYVVEECLKRGEDLVIIFKGEQMTVALERLKNPLQLIKKQFKSLYGGKPYSLYDFRFTKDGDTPKVSKKGKPDQDKLF